MANEGERRRWNDDYWSAAWLRRERLGGQVTPHLFHHLAPEAGEAILDVGCGGGRTTIAAGQAVGPEGRAVGYDLSAPLVDLARRRGEEAGATNVTFTLGDAQEADFDGARFDAAMSQFGVMFFEDPTAAFANIGRHVRPGGRLAFICWQAADRNPWNVGPLLARFAPPPPPPAPGHHPTGPFTLADPERTAAMLAAAGWNDVAATPYDLIVSIPRDALVDEDQLAFAGIPEERRAEAWEAVEAHLRQFPHSGDELEVPIAYQAVTARR